MGRASVSADGSGTSVSTARGGSSKWPITSRALWAHSTPGDLIRRSHKVVWFTGWDFASLEMKR